MANLNQLENIDEMRRREGIDDVDLRREILELGVGDFVRLTLLTGPTSFESLLVRITSIRGDNFRGKLANSPVVANCPPTLRDGSAIAFSAAHIHSLPKGQPAPH